MSFAAFYNSQSACYDIRPLTKKAGLLLRMAPKAWSAIRQIATRDHPMATEMSHRLQIPELVPPTTRNQRPWGFGPILTPRRTKAGTWVQFELRYPAKVASEEQWSWGYAATATLAITFATLSTLQGETSASHTQSMHITTTYPRRELHGCTFWWYVSREFDQWVQTQCAGATSPEITFAVTAMQKARRQLHGKTARDFGRHFVRAIWHYPSGIILQCDMDAQDIGTPGDLNYQREPKAYDMAAHNIDTPFQQLILLSGIAALWQEFDKQRP